MTDAILISFSAGFVTGLALALRTAWSIVKKIKK
jgi:hypothetical protein